MFSILTFYSGLPNNLTALNRSQNATFGPWKKRPTQKNLRFSKPPIVNLFLRNFKKGLVPKGLVSRSGE